MRELKIFNAATNEVQKLEHLGHLVSLREFDASKNRIRAIDISTFAGNMELEFLCLDENSLKSVPGLEKLERLKILYLSYNRIADLWELDKLTEMRELTEISLISNPVAKKGMYRSSVLKKFPFLKVLDGFDISEEDRDKVALAAAPHQPHKEHYLVQRSYGGQQHKPPP